MKNRRILIFFLTSWCVPDLWAENTVDLKGEIGSSYSVYRGKAFLQVKGLDYSNVPVGYSTLCHYQELISYYSEAPVIVDARMNETSWKDAMSVTFQDDNGRECSTATVHTLWDADRLYIFFRVEDTNLVSRQNVQDHPKLFMDDMVEFLVDAKNDKDSCWNRDDIVYHINLFGQKKDDRGTLACTSDPKWNGNAKSALKLIGTLNDSSDIDTGFAMEISVRWKEFGIKPAPGLSVGINFAVGNNGRLFDWVGAIPFRSPYSFGNLVLESRNE